MSDLVLYSIVLSLIFLGLYGAGKIFYSIWWKPKWLERRLRQQGITGTPYKLFIGDMKPFIKMITEAWSKPINLNHQIIPRVDPFTLYVVQKYGKISMFWNGKTPRLIISDPELMKEVLSNKLGHIQKPPLTPLILILAKGLTVLEGEKWAKHRKLINPAFHLEKLKGMIPVFAISCNKMIQEWKKMINNHQETFEVDVWPEIQKLAKDIISRAAFGSNYEEGKQIFELQHELMMLTIEAMRSLYIPGFRFLPTKKNQRRKKLNIEITSLLRNMVERKNNTIRTGQSKVDDLLSLLLHSSEQSESGIGSNGLTIEEVIEECKVFYLAGQETTSSLLTWTLIVLAMHQDWQEKAREEVLHVCGKKQPDFEDLNHFKNINMILNEVLRLYPPAIALYQHAREETKIGDITIPAGVDITLPTLLIHHDPEFWGNDADEFRPERFSAGIAKASKDQLAFFPFGWGPRTCIGQNFSMLEAKTALAMILQHFSFELSPSYCHSPYTVMILQPQHGAQLIIRQI
ncbi:cytochrome P450 CYP72A616-like [Mercurialis annua]|uniref:cytochrome P450 CYP72A616-like n=1 Tax=Mercurialis annua TaxID=3986 RepID=UPI002160744C|nr:cytochrome P450 CYP72A616-like [Mercurialis annua]